MNTNDWKQYECIEAWGAYLASFWPYVETQMRRAAEEGAPLDALYRKDDGTWARASELREGHSFYSTLAAVKAGTMRVAFKP